MLIDKKIWLATGNHNKVEEAREVLAEFGVELEHYPYERVEIQSEDPEEIATYSLLQLPDDDRPIAIEDAGLFLDYYGGFPGPYSSYALDKIGLIGILKLMEGVENREAAYHSVVALRIGGEVKCFRGTVKGRIARNLKGSHGFGYDPLFIPEEGDGRTFGEMPEEEKNEISHRARAFKALGSWIYASEEDF
ncbi:MAG: XTP/dITP diphosphatase [Candidatus Bathyarchaeota archaeon]|jgi:XTP/dITP diphosphohydrolase